MRMWGYKCVCVFNNTANECVKWRIINARMNSLVFATWSHVVLFECNSILNCMLQNEMIENESQLEMIMFCPQELHESSEAQVFCAAICFFFFFFFLFQIVVWSIASHAKIITASGCRNGRFVRQSWVRKEI